MKRFCVGLRFIYRSLKDISRLLFWLAVALSIFIGMAWLLESVAPIPMEVFDAALDVLCFSALGLGGLGLLVTWIADNWRQAKADCGEVNGPEQ